MEGNKGINLIMKKELNGCQKLMSPGFLWMNIKIQIYRVILKS